MKFLLTLLFIQLIAELEGKREESVGYVSAHVSNSWFNTVAGYSGGYKREEKMI